jgi:hypothetical protein
MPIMFPFLPPGKVTFMDRADKRIDVVMVILAILWACSIVAMVLQNTSTL